MSQRGGADALAVLNGIASAHKALQSLKPLTLLSNLSHETGFNKIVQKGKKNKNPFISGLSKTADVIGNVSDSIKRVFGWGISQEDFNRIYHKVQKRQIARGGMMTKEQIDEFLIGLKEKNPRTSPPKRKYVPKGKGTSKRVRKSKK